MKKYLLLLMGSLSINAYSQFNESAPWMVELKSKYSAKEMQERLKNPQPFTFQEVQQAFNDYWKTHDKDAKGSGYKPFKRWEFFMENEVGKNGYLPTAQDYYNAWEANNQFQASFVTGTDQSNWYPIGPFTTVGTGSWSTGQARINCVMIDPNNSNTWYVGAPAGGIWKSIDAGANWTPLTDDLPQIGVSGIAIDPNNSNIIYIATGDDDAGDALSVGVWKSIDGGETWNPTGLNPSTSPTSMNDIYIHPNNSNVLWVATNNGVYKSTNAGVSWTNTLNGNIKDIKLKPGNPNVIYAVTGSQFYKSTNGGNSFVSSNTGLPAGGSRLVIDVTPANPNYVYVFRYSNPSVGIYRSTNSGASFTTRTANVSENFSTTQAWYDLAMGVSDTNPEEIFIGCLNVWKSSNGGLNFTKINSWSAPNSATYTHGDIHFIRYYDGVIYAGTDGGVYSSTNQGASFTNHTFGIQASQVYRVAVSESNPNKLVGGLQDNGGHAFNDTSGQSNNFYGADGMDTAVNPNNENTFYGFIQNGQQLHITNNATSISSSIEGPASGNWVTPMAINSQGQLYAGYTSVYRLNASMQWEELGSLNNFFETNKCDLLEIAPSDDTVMYAVVDKTLKRSTDSGATFTNIKTFSSNIVGIGIHQYDPNTVWVTTSGAGRGVHKTTDALSTATFTNITSNLPVSGVGNFFTDIVHQGGHPNNPIFLATGVGVYRRDDSSTNWEPFMINLPHTKITDLEINEEDAVITAATYGRGVWRSAIPVDLYDNDASIQAISQPNIGITCGTVTPEFIIKNNGNNSISNIEVSYAVDEEDATSFTLNTTLASTETTTVELPDFDLERGQHTLTVSITAANDENLNNNTMTTTFNVNDAGVVNEVNEFETVNDELITEGSWERGVPNDQLLGSAVSGTQVYATNLSENYSNNTKAYLVSQCYDFTEITNPILNFDMAFDLEENWDIAYVEYSTDQGNNWEVLGTKNSTPLWYNSDRTNASSGASNDCQNCLGKQWTGEGEDAHLSGGTNATMRTYGYNFQENADNGETDLTNEPNIMFRIVFHSDQAVTEEGVNIDNFVINGQSSLSVDEVNVNTFVVYPNPSKGIVHIQLNQLFSEVDLSILDASGRLVYQEMLNNKKAHKVDLTSQSKGVYLINMKIDEKEVTKKIIIE